MDYEKGWERECPLPQGALMSPGTDMRVGLTSPETKLLLLLSRVCPSRSALDTAQVCIDEGLDWGILVSQSSHHGTYSIVYKNLLKLNSVPAHVLDTFKNAYNSTLRLNIQLISELDRILLALEKRSIPAIPLKGPTASEAIFGDIGLYPGGDIDILVKLEDLDRTIQYLESADYALSDKGFDHYRKFFIRELYHLRFSNGKNVIEPHWNLFFRYFEATPEFWWKDYILTRSGETLYRFLSPEKNIMYNSFRLFSKAFFQLRFLVMLAELIRHYEQKTDWNLLFAYAEGFGFESVLRVTLRLASELLGAPIPAEYIEIRKKRIKLLYNTAHRMAIRGGDVHPLRKVSLIFLKDDLSGIIRILLRRLFPSMGEIVLRYGLPVRSFKAVVYYALNPFLLSLREHRK
ncbi:MAG TPA: nucleotidyltransferase family protein [Thermodesulfovibrionales bacterium]|nr:nucleotidyltransferase family protein [Thermodesulfovibrionales bacterium]